MDDWLSNLGRYLVVCVFCGAFFYSAWRSFRCPRCHELGMLRDPPDPAYFPFMWIWLSMIRCCNCGYVERPEEYHGRISLEALKTKQTVAILLGLILVGFIGSKLAIFIAPKALIGFTVFGGSLITNIIGWIVA